MCNKHSGFIRECSQVMGIKVMENSQLEVIYIRGEAVVRDKLPKLAMLYLLILKLIYDEQMTSVSSSVNVYTTFSDMHERLGNYRLSRKQPSTTDIRRATSLLKKYQVIEPLETMDELEEYSRIIIYPCVSMMLLGNDVRGLLESYEGGEDEDDSDEAEI